MNVFELFSNKISEDQWHSSEGDPWHAENDQWGEQGQWNEETIVPLTGVDESLSFNSQKECMDYFEKIGKTRAQGAAAWNSTYANKKPKDSLSKVKPFDPKKHGNQWWMKEDQMAPQAQQAAQALQKGIRVAQRKYPNLDHSFAANVIREIKPDGTIIVAGENSTSKIKQLLAQGGGANFKVVSDAELQIAQQRPISQRVGETSSDVFANGDSTSPVGGKIDEISFFQQQPKQKSKLSPEEIRHAARRMERQMKLSPEEEEHYRSPAEYYDKHDGKKDMKSIKENNKIDPNDERPPGSLYTYRQIADKERFYKQHDERRFKSIRDWVADHPEDEKEMRSKYPQAFNQGVAEGSDDDFEEWGAQDPKDEMYGVGDAYKRGIQDYRKFMQTKAKPSNPYSYTKQARQADNWEKGFEDGRYKQDVAEGRYDDEYGPPEYDPNEADYDELRAQDRHDRRYSSELARHPNCNDPDHPGCENCEGDDDMDDDINENESGVYRAIMGRIVGAHKGLIAQYGMDNVMDAARHVANWNTDVKDLTHQNLSSLVREVFHKLTGKVDESQKKNSHGHSKKQQAAIAIAKQGVAETAAWQKSSGKNKNGGLNKKGVASYRREHPGSKLKTAVTKKPSEIKKGSKDASRRKSFCARMKGMKKHNTSSKTAHDPNSRINKSLRKWHCESIEELQQMLMIAEVTLRTAEQLDESMRDAFLNKVAPAAVNAILESKKK
jgi:hypothetical protein